jgi:hypothetical protein
MRRYEISTGTITHAIKGRDILRNSGFKARVERKTTAAGCGYVIVFYGNLENARPLLENAGVKILQIN